jgi:hypothetical protein
MRALVRHGGLLRCCIETIEHYEGEVVEGKVLDCQHEPPGNASLRFHDGAWGWNQGVKNAPRPNS